MLKKGNRGREVIKLQESLLSLGYELPRFGADGDFGSETESAVDQFKQDLISLAGEEDVSSELQRLINFPKGPEASYIRQMSFGLVFSSVLAVLRRRFLWFPFHPVGYAVSGSWTMSWMWFSVFLSWIIKSSILKFSGLRAYRASLTSSFLLDISLGIIYNITTH